MGTYVVGDVHGGLNRVKKLVSYIQLDNGENKLIFAGDYGDCGKYSAETLIYIMELDKKYDNVTCLIGNHDLMLLNQLKSYNHTPNIKDVYYDKNFLYTNHGKETFNNVLEMPLDKQIELERWLDNLPYRVDITINNHKYAIVHNMIQPIVDRNSIEFEEYRTNSAFNNDLRHLSECAESEENIDKFLSILKDNKVDAIITWHAPKIDKIKKTKHIIKLFNNSLIMVDYGLKSIKKLSKRDDKLLVLKLDDLEENYC